MFGQLVLGYSLYGDIVKQKNQREDVFALMFEGETSTIPNDIRQASFFFRFYSSIILIMQLMHISLSITLTVCFGRLCSIYFSQPNNI